MIDLKKKLVLLQGIVVLLPGLMLLQKNIAIPPGANRSIYLGFCEITAFILFFLIWSKKDDLNKINVKRITKKVVLNLLCFVTTFIAYKILFSKKVVANELVLPIVARGALGDLVKTLGSMDKVIQTIKVEGLYTYLEPLETEILITELVFLFLFVLVFFFLIKALWLVSIYLFSRDKVKINEAL